jgi:hypothetical protein
MTISPQWADYTPSISDDASVDRASDGGASAYSTVWTHVSAPTEEQDADPAGSMRDEFELPDVQHVEAEAGEADPVDGYVDRPERVSHEHDDDEAARVEEYTAMPGMPGRGVCLLTILAAGTCAIIDVALARGITMFFDLCFVTICLVAAMSVRRRDLFTTGVLPPLVFAAVVGAVALVNPSTFVAFGGTSKAFMTGLAQHAPGLVAGYAVALLTVGSRVSASRGR